MGRDRCVHNLGIFGGTFDPVHIGHLILAEMAREQFNLSKIFFVPAGLSPFKKTTVATGEQRLRMIKLAISSHPNFKVSDFELKLPRPSYTYDTVCHFRHLFPQSRLFFLLGEDAFKDLPGWHRVQELCELVTFLVAMRSTDSVVPPGGVNLRFRVLNSPFVDISSSLIRERCRKEKSIRYLVPERVARYIEKEQLYGLEKCL
ncbi:MAG: nicotinate-nucleotide adenylyltransferase [Candidatus Omnitrophica bacterium]|nr:nicotinate-nucleotide adenylyltransferase [Candidatus Omnitrophota bacterium]MCM8769277.1 nicotinate-nucleotide adenylyltransferase [Candidatus Omnitrophota bacterium]